MTVPVLYCGSCSPNCAGIAKATTEFAIIHEATQLSAMGGQLAEVACSHALVLQPVAQDSAARCIEGSP